MKVYYQDALRNLAEKEYSNDEGNFYETKNRDVTNIFWKQMEHYFKNGKKVSINANGETSDGKSTLMLEIVRRVNEEYLGRPMQANWILGNQQEYAQWTRNNPKETNVMVEIDEWSILATTGENSTLESAYLQEISNIHAQTFVHTGSCSPREEGDKNAFLNLEVASRTKGHTQAYLYYNLYIQGAQHRQIIGHVNIDVRKTLKAKWYKEYREQKFKRIALLREEGVDKERELIYADMIYKIVVDLQFMAKYGKYSEAMISSKAKQLSVEMKMPLTIVGRKLSIVDEAKQILDLHKHTSGINKELTRIIRKKQKTGHLIKEEEETYMDLEDAKKSYQEEIRQNMEWLSKKRMLYKKYKEIK